MGADFLYEIIPLCQLTPERKTEALRLIETCEPGDDGDLEGEGFEEARSAARSALEQYNELEGYRDVGVLHLDSRGPRYLITGGMSWGDTPSESYDSFNSMVRIPKLYESMLAWAEADAAAVRQALNVTT